MIAANMLIRSNSIAEVESIQHLPPIKTQWTDTYASKWSLKCAVQCEVALMQCLQNQIQDCRVSRKSRI